MTVDPAPTTDQPTPWRIERAVRAVDASPAMFPGIARTSRRLVLSFSTVPDGMPGGEIGVSTSEDGGLTWSAPRIVASPNGTDDAMINQVGVRALTGGTLVMPCARVSIVGGYDRREADLLVARSSDDGATWSIGEPLDLDFFEPLTYGAIVELVSGRILCPIWGRRRADERWSAAVVVSDDGAMTWRHEPVVIAYDPEARLRTSYATSPANSLDEHGRPVFENIADPDFRPHASVDGFSETSIAQLPDGELLAILRQQGVGGADALWFFRSTSNDDGATWTAPERLPITGMSPALAVLADGTLVMGYRVCAPGDDGNEPGVRLATSPDRGRTWRDEIDLVDPSGYRWTSEYQCGYPDIAELDDGTLVICFYSYDPELPHRRYVAINRVVRRRV